MTALIWDLDGTLLDSYDAILAGIEEAYAAYGLPFDREAIRTYILGESVHALFQQVAEERGIDYTAFNAARAEHLTSHHHLVKLLPFALETLQWAKDSGFDQFVYTHKGQNAHHLLKELHLTEFFTEVVTGADGFRRKPDPEALNYLIERHGLDRTKTYYIGDRLLDAECAQKAGIHSLNLQIGTNPHNQHLPDLRSVADSIEKRRSK